MRAGSGQWTFSVSIARGRASSYTIGKDRDGDVAVVAEPSAYVSDDGASTIACR